MKKMKELMEDNNFTRFNALVDVAVGVRDGTIDLDEEAAKITRTTPRSEEPDKPRATEASASSSSGGSRNRCHVIAVEEDQDDRDEANREEEDKVGVSDGPDPPPEMPRVMRDYIAAEFGARRALLIFQKALFRTDVKKDQNRLSLPESGLLSKNFLTSAEETEARRREKNKDGSKGKIVGLKVNLVCPNLTATPVDFKMWKLKTSSSYVLTNTWNKIVAANTLKKDHVIQVWFFRTRTGDPCFALVNLDHGR